MSKCLFLRLQLPIQRLINITSHYLPFNIVVSFFQWNPSLQPWPLCQTSPHMRLATMWHWLARQQVQALQQRLTSFIMMARLWQRHQMVLCSKKIMPHWHFKTMTGEDTPALSASGVYLPLSVMDSLSTLLVSIYLRLGFWFIILSVSCYLYVQ